MDDVLGIVEDDRLRRTADLQLIGDERVVEVVEAVGLGRRSVALDRDRLDPLVDERWRCRRGRRIVAVMPTKIR